ncbi:MAG: hypothetical protein QME78_12140 [Thermodesulfobacteriota bacterium]|nr:hypothetical protein [Thermodesulfobacteriota bacterium]
MTEKEIHLILKRLQKEIRALREDVQSLKESGAHGLSELRGMLRRRGLAPYRENPAHHLIFPPAFREKEREQFYELFKKYSFRLFLREILLRKGPFMISEVVRFSSPETGKKYVRFLIELGLVESVGRNKYRLWPLNTASLGATLEWFMAEMLRKEFSCPALYGLRCKGTSFGGDYDVIASLEGRLLYLEVKSSPPKNIEGVEVHEFFSRMQDLIPQVALFFVDTELRLMDKIVPIFEAERLSRRTKAIEPLAPIQKIADEIFFAPPRIYILSSKGSIPKNLASCFKHYFTFPRVEFVAEGLYS